MDAALRCFASEGFHRTTMHAIIAETGLSAGAIYRYFPSKEDIVAAIAAEHHSREESVLAQATDSADLAGILRQLVEVSLGRLDDPEEQRWRRVTVQIWGEALRDTRIMEIVREGLDEPVAILAGLFRRAHERGEIRTLDPVAAARVCAAIFQGLVLQQAWDSNVNVGAYVDTVLAILGALVGGRQEPGTAGGGDC